MTVVAKVDLEVGQKVFLTHDAPPNRKWTVRALNDRFVILTRHADFRPAGEMQYTIIDWDRGVRGPCNLIGQSWDTYMGDEAVQELLEALQRHREFIDRGPRQGRHPIVDSQVEVSYRNHVPIGVTVIP